MCRRSHTGRSDGISHSLHRRRVPGLTPRNPGLLILAVRDTRDHLDPRSVDKVQVAVGLEEDGTRARIEIANSSTPVAEHELDSIFEPFRRLHGERIGAAAATDSDSRSSAPSSARTTAQWWPARSAMAPFASR
jgi:hypothetical protein